MWLFLFYSWLRYLKSNSSKSDIEYQALGYWNETPLLIHTLKSALLVVLLSLKLKLTNSVNM